MPGSYRPRTRVPPRPGSALDQTPPPAWPARRNARATGDGLGPSTLTLTPPTAATGSSIGADERSSRGLGHPGVGPCHSRVWALSHLAALRADARDNQASWISSASSCRALSVSLTCDTPGFGVWLVGHDWRLNVISSNSFAGETGETVSETVVPDPAPRPVRRSFTAAYRLAIVAEYEAAPRGEKGAALRREGLYHSHIKEWTAARDAGARAGVGDGRKSAPGSKGSAKDRGEVERLRAQIVRLTAQLAQTRTALDIMGYPEVRIMPMFV